MDTHVAQQTEITFYSDDQGIRVTSTRLICGNTTYSMANLASVAVKRDKVNSNIIALLSVCLIVWGLGSSQKAVTASVVGAVGTLVFLGAFIIAAFRRNWNLRVTSSSGQTSLLRSRKRDYIEKVAQSIREALIHRG